MVKCDGVTSRGRRFLTVPETADALRVGEATIRRAIAVANSVRSRSGSICGYPSPRSSGLSAVRHRSAAELSAEPYRHGASRLLVFREAVGTRAYAPRVPSAAEIAYREAVRALEGQAQDLENIRSHVNVTLSAGGIAAAFLGAQSAHHCVAFWVAVAAFAGVAAVAIYVYWPIDFAWDFNGYELVTSYVDAEPPLTDDAVMRDLAVHATDDHRANRWRLEKLYNRQSLALFLFGLEVVALFAHLVFD